MQRVFTQLPSPLLNGMFGSSSQHLTNNCGDYWKQNEEGSCSAYSDTHLTGWLPFSPSGNYPVGTSEEQTVWQ